MLTDLPSDTCAEVLPGISDHNLVFSRIIGGLLAAETVSRKCFDFKKADWLSLNKALADANWAGVFQGHSASDGAKNLTETILDYAARFIPFGTKQVPRGQHPWINDKCRQMMAEKIDAYGTPNYEQKRERCSQELLKSYSHFISRTKERIKNLPSSSKHWWHLSRTLLSRTCPASSIPPLKAPEGKWIVEPFAKAQ